MQLLVLITNHGKSDLILKELNKDFDYLTNGITFLGKGTAPSDILETLSLVSNEKDISLILVKESDVSLILNKLEEKFNLSKKGKGIAFGVKLNSISSQSLEIIKKEIIGGNDNEWTN